MENMEAAGERSLIHQIQTMRSQLAEIPPTLCYIPTPCGKSQQNCIMCGRKEKIKQDIG